MDGNYSNFSHLSHLVGCWRALFNGVHVLDLPVRFWQFCKRQYCRWGQCHPTCHLQDYTRHFFLPKQPLVEEKIEYSRINEKKRLIYPLTKGSMEVKINSVSMLVLQSVQINNVHSEETILILHTKDRFCTNWYSSRMDSCG